jgi:hypothetical protein
MNELTIAGIRRGTRFSPNHTGNDAAIFRQTAVELVKLGCTVNDYLEESLNNPSAIRESYIFNMARDHNSVKRLRQYEEEGRTIINSPLGIENCTREKMTRILLAAKVPHPRSLIVQTDAEVGPKLVENGLFDCWIKRGDFHAIHREDVTYVRNISEAQSILYEYAARGIGSAVINEHLHGDLVKFYGVRHTEFFHWFYPTASHSKFGLEEINGAAQGIPFSETVLRHICNQASEALGIEVYGGDCIVSPSDGRVRIIDFNDWPSFAPCRCEAAIHIAGRIHSLITEQHYEAV